MALSLLPVEPLRRMCRDELFETIKQPARLCFHYEQVAVVRQQGEGLAGLDLLTEVDLELLDLVGEGL